MILPTRKASLLILLLLLDNPPPRSRQKPKTNHPSIRMQKMEVRIMGLKQDLCAQGAKAELDRTILSSKLSAVRVKDLDNLQKSLDKEKDKALKSQASKFTAEAKAKSKDHAEEIRRLQQCITNSRRDLDAESKSKRAIESRNLSLDRKVNVLQSKLDAAESAQRQIAHAQELEIIQQKQRAQLSAIHEKANLR